MMKQVVLGLVATCLMASSCTQPEKEQNPFFTEWNTPFQVPPFELIKNGDYLPAFKAAIAENQKEIEAIANSQEAPTFANTIEALEYGGKLLSKVSSVFYNITGAETNDSLQAVAKEISPMMSEHSDNLYLNAALFQRIKTIFENQAAENLSPEQARVLEKYYKNFVRAGANLTDEQKSEMRNVNKELSMLSLQFQDNVLSETNNFALELTKDQLGGLPQWFVSAAAEAAKAKGIENGWVVTLQNPSWIPFLQYSDNRDLREKVYMAYINRCDNGNEFDNNELITKLSSLRLRRAQLLGYNSFADFVLEETMAKKSENVMGLLENIWQYAVPKAKSEIVDMQSIMNSDAKGQKLEAWDWWYYADKVRQQRYALNEDELKPYFQMEKVRDGAFMVANNLWGISFTEIKDIPVYNEEVKAFEVKDKDGSHLAVLYVDYFPRPGKRGGAWMSSYRGQSIENGKNIRPVITNVGNFTRPTGDMPSLLTIGEVETLFHEFGHALHGIFSNVTYPSVAGTAVSRDFVELPSQIMEHWAMQPEVLKAYAHHYQTGEVIPDALIEKINNAGTFNQGFSTTEIVAAAILDMNWHMQSSDVEMSPKEFEKSRMNAIGLISEIAPRYRSAYFRHIFAGGYSAGYYSYLWAEVLDADAFKAFEEKGIYDAKTAALFRDNILSKGGSADPMELYLKFRGAEPKADALLKNRGLN
ncbi:MAG: M3 family metallopeptidase [Bacteroidales bacterium]